MQLAKWNIEVDKHIDKYDPSPSAKSLTNLELVPDKMSVRKQIRKEYGDKFKKLSVENVCNQVNTPSGFQVCASGVTLALSPCKPVGHVSYVDKDAKATQTMVWAKDGKRANQSCSYMRLKDVPDSILPDERKLE